VAAARFNLQRMKKFFGFGPSTPPPPPPPSRPPAPPAKPATPAKPQPAAETASAAAAPAQSAPSIVGRWKEPQGSDTTEFHADGTVTERPASGETIRGRYSLEGGKLKIKLEGVADEIVFTASVGADSLEMSDADGHMTLYKRA
jgi:hypothetical protein